MLADKYSKCICKCCNSTKVARHRPVLVKNFSTRVKINLIDYSDTSDKPCKCLLIYWNHRIKIVNARSLTEKYFMAVTCALLSAMIITAS